MMGNEKRQNVIHDDSSNGGPSWKWLAILFIGALFTVSGAVMTRNFSNVESNEKRIGTLEVNFAAMQKDIDYTRNGVDEIKTLLRLQFGRPQP